jgi:hypothetical protein
MEFLTGILVQLLLALIGKLSEWLFSLAERAARFNKIDQRIKPIVDEALRVRDRFKAVNEDATATPEAKAQAYEDFKASRRKFHLVGV